MIPLYKPYMPDLPDLGNILYSGQLATGLYTKKFEEKLMSFFNMQRVLAVNSFSSAIFVALTSCGLKRGDEIIASPMTCLVSMQSYSALGVKIVWADIDPQTGTLDPASVEKKITSSTKGIIHNHFCGYPGYIDEVNAIGKKYGIIVIDDGIECFGTTYKGKLIGSCGTDITVFSFNPVRVLTTIEGGAILFADADIYEKASLIKDCGINRNIFRDELGEINPQCDITVQGYSATLNNINAYVGVQQFNSIRLRLKQQKNNAKKWDEKIQNMGEYKPLGSPNGEPNYWVYGILAPDKIKCIKRFRELGYYASGVHINNNIYSVFGKEDTLPGVQEFYNSFVALPCGWWINEKD